MVPQTENKKPKTRDPEAGDQGPESSNKGPEIRDQGPKTKVEGSETIDEEMKPKMIEEVRDPKHRMSDLKTGMREQKIK